MPNYLTISPSHIEGGKRSAWGNFRDGGYIAIGWLRDDLTGQSIKDIEAFIRKKGFSNQSQAINAYKALFSLKAGDYIAVTNNGHGIFGIGKVKSDEVKFQVDKHNPGTGDKDQWYCYYKEVEWLDTQEAKRKDILLPGERSWPPYGTVGELKNEVPAYIQRRLGLAPTTPVEARPNEKTMKAPLNQILYGPPGTGKTYRLSSEYHPIFTDTSSTIDSQQQLRAFVQEFPWWRVIAAALFLMPDRRSKVPELAQHPLIQAKFNPSTNYSTPNHILWQQLQFHNVDDSPNLVQANHPSRIHIFQKLQGSVWTLAEDDNLPIWFGFEPLLNFNNLPATAGEHFTFITFHQSFAYEDFIEGIKPVLGKAGEFEEDDRSDNNISYEIRKGIFFKSCQSALELAGYRSFSECFEDSKENRHQNFKTAKPYGLFIDEINRANVSNVFGELITLIEEDKRLGSENEIWADLPYSQERFGVPANLILIGTMNTADRSVEALDTALRRRFRFEEMQPRPDLLTPANLVFSLWLDYSNVDWDDTTFLTEAKSLYEMLGCPLSTPNEQQAIWNELGNQPELFGSEEVEEAFNQINFTGINLKKLLEVINLRLEKLRGLEYCIGHAYLIKVRSLTDLQITFSKSIVPLLQEYFFGDWAKIGMVLGRAFVAQEQIEVAFADFDADSTSTSDLDNRPLYRITDSQEWTLQDFISIYEPVNGD